MANFFYDLGQLTPAQLREIGALLKQLGVEDSGIQRSPDGKEFQALFSGNQADLDRVKQAIDQKLAEFRGGAAPGTSTGNTVEFDRDVNRSVPAQQVNNGVVSAARVGKPGGTGIIEDNGVGISNVGDMSLGDAAGRLRRVFNTVRNLPPVSGNNQAGATAAAAITTRDGVAWRGAGDAVVVAVGDNGQVIVLNDLHTGVGGEVVTNSLRPGVPGMGDGAEAGSATWAQLQQRLGTGKMRIAVLSDGISGSHTPEQIAADIQNLIRTNKIDFNDPNWASKLLQASSQTSYSGYKPDDRVVVSAQRPATAQENSMLVAADGVGSGGRDSAEVAHQTVQAAKQEAAGAPPQAAHAADDEATVRMNAADPQVVAARATERLNGIVTSNRIGVSNGQLHIYNIKDDAERAAVVKALGIDPKSVRLDGRSLAINLNDAATALNPSSQPPQANTNQQKVVESAQQKLPGRNVTMGADGKLRVDLADGENSGLRTLMDLGMDSRKANAAMTNGTIVRQGNMLVIDASEFGNMGLSSAGGVLSTAARIASPFKKALGIAGKILGVASVAAMASTVGTTLAHAAEPGDAATAERDTKNLAGMAYNNPVGAFAAIGTAILSDGIKEMARLAGVQTGPTIAETFAALSQKIGAERAAAGVAATPLASAAGALLNNLSPAFGSAEFKGAQGLVQAARNFRGEFTSVGSGNTAALTDQAANFADKLAQQLRDNGPAGEAVRKAMADYLQKQGLTPEQYAERLTEYAEALRSGGPMPETGPSSNATAVASANESAGQSPPVPAQRQGTNASRPPGYTAAPPAPSSPPPAAASAQTAAAPPPRAAAQAPSG